MTRLRNQAFDGEFAVGALRDGEVDRVPIADVLLHTWRRGELRSIVNEMLMSPPAKDDSRHFWTLRLMLRSSPSTASDLGQRTPRERFGSSSSSFTVSDRVLCLSAQFASADAEQRARADTRCMDTRSSFVLHDLESERCAMQTHSEGLHRTVQFYRLVTSSRPTTAASP